MADTVAAVHGPYEDLAIAALNLVGKIIDSQPPEVKAKLWDQYISDMEAWRNFWAKVASVTGIMPKS